MNKRLLPLMLFPLVLTIASCNGQGGASSGESIINQKDVDTLKSILSKQDLSPFNEKYFYGVYSQNFSVYTNMIDEEEEYGTYVDFFNYRGNGGVGYYYNVDEEDYEKVIEDEDANIFDIMCQGFGYYALNQSATIYSYLHDDFEETQDSQRITYFQLLSALLDDTNVQIENTFILADYFDDENNQYRLFNGAIEKDILFSSYTTKTIADIFSRVNIYGGPETCEAIDTLFYQICLSLSESTDKEISEFLINNNVEYAESDYYFDLSFELKEEKYIELLDESDVIPGIVKGTLHLDKETQVLDSFEYKIVRLEEEVDYDTNYIHTVSMEFKVEGESRHGKPEVDPSVSEDPEVFTEPDEFIEKVIEEVVPTIGQ